jgi:hypothetical protein
MGVRILLSWTVEGDPRKLVQPEVGRIETRMLPGDDKGWINSPRPEGACNRLELNGFGPGPDDQPDISGTQPSP